MANDTNLVLGVDPKLDGVRDLRGGHVKMEGLPPGKARSRNNARSNLATPNLEDAESSLSFFSVALPPFNNLPVSTELFVVNHTPLMDV